MDDPADRYRTYLETLTPDTLARLADHVADDVRFKDPFNDVRGVQAMAGIFQHMFETVGPVTFVVTDMVSAADRCFMAWRFEARLRGQPWSFEGTSIVHFDGDGRVTEHIDHWDAATAFYERLPVIGWLLARLRRKVASR